MQTLQDILTERVHSVLAARRPAHRSLNEAWDDIRGGRNSLSKTEFQEIINGGRVALNPEQIDIIWANTGAGAEFTYRDFVQFALLDCIEMGLTPRSFPPMIPLEVLNARAGIICRLMEADIMVSGKIDPDAFKMILMEQCRGIKPETADGITKAYTKQQGKIEYHGFLSDLCKQLPSDVKSPEPVVGGRMGVPQYGPRPEVPGGFS
jgi:hypothetical protein